MSFCHAKHQPSSCKSDFDGGGETVVYGIGLNGCEAETLLNGHMSDMSRVAISQFVECFLAVIPP